MCLKTVTGVSKGMLHVTYIYFDKSLLFQLFFWEIVRLPHSEGISDFPKLLGIQPDSMSLLPYQ